MNGVIGFRTAIMLLAVLAAAAALTLKGKALILVLLIIGALAAKVCLHHLRSRIE